MLAAALLIVVLLDPWAVLSPGFWLSFGAVGVIMFVCNGRVGRPHWLSAWARVQFAVTLAMIPLLLALFQQVSVVSPIANALAIPAVGLGRRAAHLARHGAAVRLDAAARAPGDGVVHGALEWLSSLDAAVWEQRAPPAWAVVAAICGALLMLLAPRGMPGRWLGAAGLLPSLRRRSRPRCSRAHCR